MYGAQWSDLAPIVGNSSQSQKRFEIRPPLFTGSTEAVEDRDVTFNQIKVT